MASQAQTADLANDQSQQEMPKIEMDKETYKRFNPTLQEMIDRTKEKLTSNPTSELGFFYRMTAVALEKLSWDWKGNFRLPRDFDPFKHMITITVYPDAISEKYYQYTHQSGPCLHIGLCIKNSQYHLTMEDWVGIVDRVEYNTSDREDLIQKIIQLSQIQSDTITFQMEIWSEEDDEKCRHDHAEFSPCEVPFPLYEAMIRDHIVQAYSTPEEKRILRKQRSENRGKIPTKMKTSLERRVEQLEKEIKELKETVNK